jgi:hypothetical protein
MLIIPVSVKLPRVLIDATRQAGNELFIDYLADSNAQVSPVSGDDRHRLAIFSVFIPRSLS